MRVLFVFMIILSSGCGGGSGSNPEANQSPPVTNQETLLWDSGNWDQYNWQ